MVLSGDVFRLAEDSVDSAPARGGIYALYKGNELIYIGIAEDGDTIRARLRHHLSCTNPCTVSATAYRYEVCENPKNREEFYLREYRRSFMRLPRCNDGFELKPCHF